MEKVIHKLSFLPLILGFYILISAFFQEKSLELFRWDSIYYTIISNANYFYIFSIAILISFLGFKENIKLFLISVIFYFGSMLYSIISDANYFYIFPIAILISFLNSKENIKLFKISIVVCFSSILISLFINLMFFGINPCYALGIIAIAISSVRFSVITDTIYSSFMLEQIYDGEDINSKTNKLLII